VSFRAASTPPSTRTVCMLSSRYPRPSRVAMTPEDEGTPRRQRHRPRNSVDADPVRQGSRAASFPNAVTRPPALYATPPALRERALRSCTSDLMPRT
jgi:hypothetical protein